MIRPGLCSVTFRKMSVPEVVAVCREARLEGVEWGGDVHVPHGDLERAGETGASTRVAGMEVASYGSYYRAGVSEDAGLSFQSVLETALALGAPNVRVWAGDRDYEAASADFIEAVARDARRIAGLAEARGVTVTFEHHAGSLTNRAGAALAFLRRADHENLFLSWQPEHGASVETNLENLRGVLPRLSTLHVFHWTLTTVGDGAAAGGPRLERHALAGGTAAWRRYLEAAAQTGRDHWALLEFVAGDAPAQAVADAATLRELCAGL